MELEGGPRLSGEPGQLLGEWDGSAAEKGTFLVIKVNGKPQASIVQA